MNILKKIERSDWLIIIAFWIVSSPLIVQTFSGYTEHTALERNLYIFRDYLIYIVFDTALVLFIVHYLFGILLKNGKYIMLIFLLILSLAATFVIRNMVWDFFNNDDVFHNFNGYTIKKLTFYTIGTAQNIGVLTTLLVALNFYRMQKKVLLLEKERKENELRWLKAQIDPHFLFNNLNILSILIKKDQEKASVYVEKLSSLYRYLVRQQDQDVVAFKEEWSFAKNYMFLIRERFGNAYENIIDIDFEKHGESLLPPASIQMLLENVIKHNEGNPSNPLKIFISIQNKNLIIKNEIRMKNVDVDSTGTGLKNLQNRIKLLTDDEIVIIKTSDSFEVRLPLVKQIN